MLYFSCCYIDQHSDVQFWCFRKNSPIDFALNRATKSILVWQSQSKPLLESIVSWKLEKIISNRHQRSSQPLLGSNRGDHRHRLILRTWFYILIHMQVRSLLKVTLGSWGLFASVFYSWYIFTYYIDECTGEINQYENKWSEFIKEQYQIEIHSIYYLMTHPHLMSIIIFKILLARKVAI